ncbi:MAG: hypothetical protein ACYC3G_01055 [Minisyncoccota bacterium]
METIQLLSIVVEAVIVGILLYAAIKKQRICAWGMALTFSIYVFYDTVHLFNIDVSQTIMIPVFFIASISALWAVLKMSQD